MRLNTYDILPYLPQRPPMLMVDRLLEYDENRAVAALQLSRANLFCKAGYFREPGLVEHVAQTAALHSGYGAFLEKRPVPLGYIGAVKRFEIFELPSDNKLITGTIEVLNRFENATIIKGEVRCNGRLIAEGELNIFLQT